MHWEGEAPAEPGWSLVTEHTSNPMGLLLKELRLSRRLGRSLARSLALPVLKNQRIVALALRNGPHPSSSCGPDSPS